ncbi:MAG: GAF domain-containing protein [Gemmatimonadaceae bacterium]
MTESSGYPEDEFVPKRPTGEETLLSTSGTIAVVDLLRVIAAERRDRQYLATRAAEILCRIGPYRWVGIYDIGPEDAHVFAWSGKIGPPAFVRFPKTAGLTGQAVKTNKTVVVNDVSKSDTYLTAFAGTHSEIIVPILDPTQSHVIGTIDVESDRLNAFRPADQKVLEQCALALASLWK